MLDLHTILTQANKKKTLITYALESWSLRGEFCWTAKAKGFLLNSLPTDVNSQLVITAYLTCVESAEREIK